MDGEYEFNSRVIIFGIIGFIFLVLIFFPYQSLEKPINASTVNLTLTDEDKLVIYNKLTPEERIKVINYLKPQPTPTPIIETVYVTPTPDNGIYYAEEYLSGIRKMDRYFSWYVKNATGYKNLNAHVKVYGYRMLDTYHWFNPADYTYYETYPISPDDKFLFIYAKIFIDNIGGDDTRMWFPNESHYGVQANNIMYYPISFPRQIRIEEFENTYNDGKLKMLYYGSTPMYSHADTYRATAGEYNDPETFMQAGESNAADGYIAFEVPKNTQPEDIIVKGNFYDFGDSGWVLKQ